MYENWTIEKNLIWSTDEETRRAALEDYAAAAQWCNEQGNYTIIEVGDFYKVVKIEVDDSEILENLE